MHNVFKQPSGLLRELPPEIILRIIAYLDLQATGRLLRLSRPWHAFINENESTIYSDPSKVGRPANVKDFSFLPRTLTRYYDDVSSWKDACLRRKLLAKNWSAARPSTSETIVSVPVTPRLSALTIWRFKLDVVRRICIAVTAVAGLRVICLDTQRTLWASDAVDAYSHLEYEDGVAVNEFLGSLVIWKHVERLLGSFEKVASIDLQIRGKRYLHLHNRQLCVLGEQTGYIYDLREEPTLLRTLEIVTHPLGYSLGHPFLTDGILVYPSDHVIRFVDMTTANKEGGFCPDGCRRRLRIVHIFGEGTITKRLEIQPGPLRSETYRAADWGAVVIHGNTLISIAKQGLIFCCCDWRRLFETGDLDSSSVIIETEANELDWAHGGMLSTDGQRAIFEVSDAVYVLTLPEGGLPQAGQSILAINKASLDAHQHPVSSMQVFEDCIAMTYNLLQRAEGRDGPHPFRLSNTVKSIRFLSFAPDLGPGIAQDVH